MHVTATLALIVIEFALEWKRVGSAELGACIEPISMADNRVKRVALATDIGADIGQAGALQNANADTQAKPIVPLD